MLIIVNAPCAYGAVNIGSSSPNTLMSYPGEPEPGITGVSLETETKYNIIWDNPVPIDTPNSIPLSYWADSYGLTTRVNIVPLRNRSEFTGSTVPYTVHLTRQNYNPETQNPIPNVTASPARGTPPGVGPASGWLATPAQQNQADPYGTGSVDAPVNSLLTAIIQMGYDIERIAKMFVVNILFPSALHTTFPVLPANGGTKALDITIPDGDNITVKVDNDAGTLGATMQVFPEDQKTHVVDTQNPLTADGNGFVTLETGKGYRILLTSQTKAAQANWDDVLAKDNVTLQYYKADKTTTIGLPFKFTVFWVKLDVDPALLKNGTNELAPTKQLPVQPQNEYDDPRTYEHIELKLRNWAQDLWGSDLVGRQLTDVASWGTILVRGTIVPSGLNAANFQRDWTGQTGFSFKRMIWTRAYFGDAGDFAEWQTQISTAERANNGNVAGLGVWDEEAPQAIPNGDEDLCADNDAGNDLLIYAIDWPSMPLGFTAKVGDIVRLRFHAMEFVYYSGQHCSDGDDQNPINGPGYKWSCYQSVEAAAKQGGGIKLVENAAHNGAGDNKVIAGSWPCNLSVNLANATPNLPFGLTNVGVERFTDIEKKDFEVILEGGTHVWRTMKITGQDFPNADVDIGLKQTLSAGDETLIDVSAIARNNATEIEAHFNFDSHHNIDHPGDYRIKVTINNVSVVLVDSKKQFLRVIGKLTHWEFKEIARHKVYPNRRIIIFVGKDAVGHPAKGLDKTKVYIDTLPPMPVPPTVDDLLAWLDPTKAVEDSDFELTGDFYREFVIQKNGATKFKITYNNDEPSLPTEEQTLP